MRLEFDPRLLEDVVFLEVRRRETSDPQLVRDYRAQVDPLYERAQPGDERELAFRDAHAALFRDLGFETRFTQILREFPLLPAGLDAVAVFKAVTRKEESADLFVRPDEADSTRSHRTAVVRVRAETVIDEARLREWLRRELYHVQDMVDPAFAYQPNLRFPDPNPVRVDLLRDRYRVLWDAWIDTRLGRPRADAIAAESARAFSGLPLEDRRRLLRSVYESERLTHDDLLRLARTGMLEEAAKLGPVRE